MRMGIDEPAKGRALLYESLQRTQAKAHSLVPKSKSPFLQPCCGGVGGGRQQAWPAQQPQGKNLQSGLSFLTSCKFRQRSQNVKPGTSPPGFCNLRIKQTGSLTWGGLGMREHVQKFSKIRFFRCCLRALATSASSFPHQDKAVGV